VPGLRAGFLTKIVIGVSPMKSREYLLSAGSWGKILGKK
jgi:hypothetical protein